MIKSVYCFVAAWMILPAFALAQVNLNGGWAGYITQNSPTAIADNYQFKLFVYTDGDWLEGTTEIRLWNDESVYGIMRISGKQQGNVIRFTELEIMEQHISLFAYWCLKEITLKYSNENGVEKLTGTWLNEICNGPGEVYLERSPSA
ncbi:MAG: hypothetical protein MH137_10405 [Flavobacteriales bacterium]|nr:hypothetical protein [Flavobacteriales bacterium]